MKQKRAAARPPFPIDPPSRIYSAAGAAASALSVPDYLGEIPWDSEPAVRDWYARVKSRPSFRPILADKLAGLPPASHYVDLDF